MTHLSQELDDALVHDVVGEHALVVQLADELDVTQHALPGLVLSGHRTCRLHLEAPLCLGWCLGRGFDLQTTTHSLCNPP